jgi:hypothetical protein
VKHESERPRCVTVHSRRDVTGRQRFDRHRGVIGRGGHPIGHDTWSLKSILIPDPTVTLSPAAPARKSWGDVVLCRLTGDFEVGAPFPFTFLHDKTGSFRVVYFLQTQFLRVILSIGPSPETCQPANFARHQLSGRILNR